MVRKQTYIVLLGLLTLSCAKPEPALSQELRERVEFSIDGLFSGVYSEVLEQPLEVTYIVPCPDGDASRTGFRPLKPDLEGMHLEQHFEFRG